MYDIMLSGYYGFGNSGDEALLQVILRDLRACRPDLKIAVLSQDPAQTAQRYGVDAIDRMDWKKISHALRITRLLLSGGGSLIQDATSSKSLYYYLAIIRMAKSKGCKVMLYANGIGPVTKPFNRRFAARVLNRIDRITLREPDSLGELTEMGVNVPEITVTADPALGLKPCGREHTAQLLQALGCSKNPIVLSLRSWKNCDERLVREVKKYIIEMKSRYGYQCLLVPMQESCDTEICRKAAQGTDAVVADKPLSAEELLGIFERSAAVIGMRLHALIYAAAVGAAPVGIVYDPKVKGYLRYLGLQTYLPVEKVTSAELVRLTALAKTSSYQHLIPILQQKSAETARIAVSLLGTERNGEL